MIGARHISLAVGGLALLASVVARADDGYPIIQPAAPPDVTMTDAILPQMGSGLLAAEGGLKYAVPDAFASGIKVKSQMLGPALIAPFMYQVDNSWAILIEVGYATDQFSLAGSPSIGSGTLGVQTVSVLLGGQWLPKFGWHRVQPFVGAGFGYYLSSLSLQGFTSANTTNPPPSESNTTGFFASLGVRIALSARLGFIVEDRFAYAVPGAGYLGNVMVGGNTAAAGLYIVWNK